MEEAAKSEGFVADETEGKLFVVSGVEGIVGLGEEAEEG